MLYENNACTYLLQQNAFMKDALIKLARFDQFMVSHSYSFMLSLSATKKCLMIGILITENLLNHSLVCFEISKDRLPEFEVIQYYQVL